MKNLKQYMGVCLAVFLMLTGVLCNSMTVQAADTDEHRMNVVFVLDQSGSMAKTDANALRYEAVDLFLGLSTETGNYMGAVVFDDSIVLQRDVTEITGKESKQELSDSIKAAKSFGDTNIGMAIELATQMLQNSGNPNLRSAIILLSDGNTDLPKDTTGQELAASEQSKTNAIDTARAQGIRIHSVCLNANGAAKKQELQDISDATGGVCVEVKSAEDLKEVFNQFYNIIYSTETINIADTVIPENGELEVPFTIPAMGVEEANIIINTLNPDTTYNLLNPDGYGYIQAEMDAMSIKAKTFTVIKIEKPKFGEWILKVRGISGDQVKVDMVYNASISIDLTSSTGSFEWNAGDTAEVMAVFSNMGNTVTDANIYQQYPISLKVTDASGTTVMEETMEVKDASAEATTALQLTNGGEYTVTATSKIDDMTVSSIPVTVKITASAQAAPVATAAPNAPEKEGMGLLPILLIVLLVVLLAVVLLVILSKKKGSGIIRGRIQFSGYNDGYLGSPQTFDGTKGKMILSRYLDYSEDVGVELGTTYLKAGERDSYIYLISPKGYYTDANPDAKNKKIRLDAEMEVQVSSDIDFSKYLKITYIPDDMGY